MGWQVRYDRIQNQTKLYDLSEYCIVYIRCAVNGCAIYVGSKKSTLFNYAPPMLLYSQLIWCFNGEKRKKNSSVQIYPSEMVARKITSPCFWALTTQRLPQSSKRFVMKWIWYKLKRMGIKIEFSIQEMTKKKKKKIQLCMGRMMDGIEMVQMIRTRKKIFSLEFPSNGYAMKLSMGGY